MEKTVAVLAGGTAGERSSFCGDFLKEYRHVDLGSWRARLKEDRVLADCVLRGCSFVVDQANLTRQARKKYISLGKRQGYRVIGYCFDDASGTTEPMQVSEGYDALYRVHRKDNRFHIEELWI